MCASRKLIGILVTDDDARGECDEVARLVRVVPDRDATLGDVHLAERERQERHVPVGIGTVGQRGDEMLMGVAGEGTPVVPVHGECAHSTCNTTPSAVIPCPRTLRLPALRRSVSSLSVRPADRSSQTCGPGGDPGRPACTALTMGRRPRPSTEPMAAPPSTSLGWCGSQVHAAGGDRGGEADVGDRLGVGVGEHEGGAERSQGVAAREAAARWRAHRGLEVVVGPLALDRLFHHPAHDQGGEAGRGKGDHGTAPVRPAPTGLEPGQQRPRRARSRRDSTRRRRPGRPRAGRGEGRRRHRPPGPGCSSVRHAANAGQEVLKWQWSQSGPTFGRKSSASQARSMAVQTATARLRWPRMLCSEATEEMAIGWRR